MLCQYHIGNHITFDDLRIFAWNGNVFNNAKIIEFKKDYLMSLYNLLTMDQNSSFTIK